MKNVPPTSPQCSFTPTFESLIFVVMLRKLSYNLFLGFLRFRKLPSKKKKFRKIIQQAFIQC